MSGETGPGTRLTRRDPCGFPCPRSLRSLAASTPSGGYRPPMPTASAPPIRSAKTGAKTKEQNPCTQRPAGKGLSTLVDQERPRNSVEGPRTSTIGSEVPAHRSTCTVPQTSLVGHGNRPRIDF